MKKFTIEDIRKLRPCYDPSRHLPENWTGTVVDILEVDRCPAQDRLWVALRLLENRLILEMFAIDCAFSAAAAAASTPAIGTRRARAKVTTSAAAARAAAARAAAAHAARAAAAYVAERERQIDALIYLLRGSE